MSIRLIFSGIKFGSRNLVEWGNRYSNVAFFFGGFLFDILTITRIDAISDLVIQIVYLTGLSLLLVYQHREHRGLWRPGKWVGKIWHYNVEILHFLYGGLLSAYVVLYFKSTSGFHAILFVVFLATLMVLNEMPQIRRFGYRLRLGLYGFCVVSFLIYFIPILVGRVNDYIFILSLVASAAIVWRVAGRLAAKEPSPKSEQKRLFIPAGALFLVIGSLYFLRLIPPVPLSVKYQGVFHDIEKTDGHYRLRFPDPPFWAFWRNDSQPFKAREGDEVYYFTRIYAPARFKHKVMIRWEFFNDRNKEFVTTDLRPLSVVGGRQAGFRGYISKSNYQPGLWRVSSETQDGRTIGNLTFHIKKDESTKERKWEERSM